jgi:hypothetical protein
MAAVRKHLAKRWHGPQGVSLRCTCKAWESGTVGTIREKEDAHRAHRVEMGEAVRPRTQPLSVRLAAEVERLQAQVRELQGNVLPADTMIEMSDGMADMTAAEKKDGTLIKVRGEVLVYEFFGELLANVTKDNPNAERWTDINLYRFTDGTGRYFLQSIGRSWVYHRVGGPCKRGIPTAVGDVSDDFYDNASPCSVPGCCPEPLDVLSDDDEVRQERSVYQTWECATPKDIIQGLREQSQRTRRGGMQRSGAGNSQIGMPGMTLLHQAAGKDPRIAESLLTTVRL